MRIILSIKITHSYTGIRLDEYRGKKENGYKVRKHGIPTRLRSLSSLMLEHPVHK